MAQKTFVGDKHPGSQLGHRADGLRMTSGDLFALVFRIILNVDLFSIVTIKKECWLVLT